MDINDIKVDHKLVAKLKIAKELAESIGDKEMASKLEDRINHESSKFNKMLEAYMK